MKIQRGDQLVLQLGALYKRKFIAFDIDICLRVMNELHPELGFSQSSLKRLIDQGGVKAYWLHKEK